MLVTTSKVPPLLWPTNLKRRTYGDRKVGENQIHIKKLESRKYQWKTGLLTIPHSLPTAKQEVLGQKEIAVTDASTPVMSIPFA